MDQKNIGRLNQLFEKMVSNNVSISERNELENLYSRFIDEGRLGSKLRTIPRERDSITPKAH